MLTGIEGHAMAQGLTTHPLSPTPDPHTYRRDHTSDGSMAFEHQEEEPEGLRQVCLDRRHERALHHQGRPEQHEHPRRYFGVKISSARCPSQGRALTMNLPGNTLTLIKIIIQLIQQLS